ncbi:MAG: AsmA family protein [Verrucomicrobiota bacterium]
MKCKTSSSSGFSVLKFLLFAVLALVLLVVVFLTFLLSPTAKWIANSQLPKILGTEASIQDLKINLWSGDVEVKGVRVADPDNADGVKDLFLLESLVIDVDPSSVFGDVIKINEIAVTGPSVSIDRDKDGKFSFEKLAVMQPTEETEPEPEPAPESGGGKAIQIDSISVTSLSAYFSDEGSPNAKNVYDLTGFNFLGEGITVNPGSSVASVAEGVSFALLKLSDAKLVYSTNELPQPETTEPVTDETIETALSEDAEEIEEQPTDGDTTDPIYIGDFLIENFQLEYSSRPANDEDLDVKVDGFQVRGKNIAFDPSGVRQPREDEVMTGEISFRIEQEAEGVTAAEFDSVVKSTVIGSGIPVTAGRFQLTGFELQTVGSLVPAGTQTAIGGPAFDLTGRWFVSSDELDGKITLVSSNNVTTSVTLSGTPDNPRINGGEMLLNVIGRPGQFLGNLAGDAMKGSMEVVSGAADAAGTLARGAGDTVMNLGRGIFDTGKALARGDLKGAGKGLEKATVGTVTTAGSALGDSAEAATEGAVSAVSSGTGANRQANWREASTKRHEEFQAAAKQWLEEGTFPPVSEPKPEETLDEPVNAQRGDSDAERAREAVEADS